MALANKLGIADDVELAREEERISKVAALSLYRDGTLDRLTPGTFDTLKRIHGALSATSTTSLARCATSTWPRAASASRRRCTWGRPSGASRPYRRASPTRSSRSTSR